MFIKSKKIDYAALDALVNSGLNPHLAKFYSARGIKHIDDATLSASWWVSFTLTQRPAKASAAALG